MPGIAPSAAALGDKRGPRVLAKLTTRLTNFTEHSTNCATHLTNFTTHLRNCTSHRTNFTTGDMPGVTSSSCGG